jgi:hypothetical protein
MTTQCECVRRIHYSCDTGHSPERQSCLSGVWCGASLSLLLFAVKQPCKTHTPAINPTPCVQKIIIAALLIRADALIFLIACRHALFHRAGKNTPKVHFFHFSDTFSWFATIENLNYIYKMPINRIYATQ